MSKACSHHRQTLQRTRPSGEPFQPTQSYSILHLTLQVSSTFPRHALQVHAYCYPCRAKLARQNSQVDAGRCALPTSPSPPESSSAPVTSKPGALKIAELQQHQPVPTDAHSLLSSAREAAANLSATGACAKAGNVARAVEVDRLSASECPPDMPHTDAEEPKAALPDHCVAVACNRNFDSLIRLGAQTSIRSLSLTESTRHDCGSRAARPCPQLVQDLQPKDEGDASGNVAADRGTVLPDTGLQAVVSKDATFLEMLFCCPITKVMS